MITALKYAGKLLIIISYKIKNIIIKVCYINKSIIKTSYNKKNSI